MVGQGVVNLAAWEGFHQELREPRPVILIVQELSQVRALHDAGEKETHIGQLLEETFAIRLRRRMANLLMTTTQFNLG
jgi:hypothetical protein